MYAFGPFGLFVSYFIMLHVAQSPRLLTKGPYHTQTPHPNTVCRVWVAVDLVDRSSGFSGFGVAFNTLRVHVPK